MNKNAMSFPCAQCGHCCRHIRQAVENARQFGFPDEVSAFPYSLDAHGVCSQLDESNCCKVYADRPLLCNVQQMYPYFNLPWEEFVRLN